MNRRALLLGTAAALVAPVLPPDVITYTVENPVVTGPFSYLPSMSTQARVYNRVYNVLRDQFGETIHPTLETRLREIACTEMIDLCRQDLGQLALTHREEHPAVRAARAQRGAGASAGGG